MSGLLETNENEALKVLKFAIFNFEFSYDSFPRIFLQLFSRLPMINNILLALQILNSIADHIDVIEIEVDDSIKLYKKLVNKSKLEITNEFTELFRKLMQKNIVFPKLLKFLNKFTTSHFLFGTSLILKLKVPISTERLFRVLEFVSTESSTQACELLTAACEVSAED